jgi:pilus assembly protein TadC
VKENKIRHRLAVGKGGEDSLPQELYFGGVKMEGILYWEWFWKLILSLPLFFAFLLILFVLDE